MDQVNTVENVFIRYGSPQWQAGPWTVEVSLSLLSADGNPETPESQSWDVDFSLVVSGLVSTTSRDPGDWNKDTVVDTTDVADFLRDFFAGEADFDGDGSTSVKDLLDFLAVAPLQRPA